MSGTYSKVSSTNWNWFRTITPHTQSHVLRTHSVFNGSAVALRAFSSSRIYVNHTQNFFNLSLAMILGASVVNETFERKSLACGAHPSLVFGMIYAENTQLNNKLDCQNFSPLGKTNGGASSRLRLRRHETGERTEWAANINLNNRIPRLMGRGSLYLRRATTKIVVVCTKIHLLMPRV